MSVAMPDNLAKGEERELVQQICKLDREVRILNLTCEILHKWICNLERELNKREMICDSREFTFELKCEILEMESVLRDFENNLEDLEDDLEDWKEYLMDLRHE